jgi:hypothetical protein
MTFVLTGLDIEAKAEIAQRALWARIPGGRDAFDEVAVRLLRADRTDPRTADEAVALLTVSVAAGDKRLAGMFSRAAVEVGLASYPGLYFTEPPGPGSAYTVFWPTLLPAADFPQQVALGDRRWTVAPPPSTGEQAAEPPAPAAPSYDTANGPTERVPLGLLAGGRSGDKGGNATLGFWARDDARHGWLAAHLTEERLRALLPEAEGCAVRRWELPNLRAVGFTVVGLLGRGVAANLRLDSQAKGLAEYLRAKHVDAPSALVAAAMRTHDHKEEDRDR